MVDIVLTNNCRIEPTVKFGTFGTIFELFIDICIGVIEHEILII